MMTGRFLLTWLIAGCIGGCNWGANSMDMFVARSFESCGTNNSCEVDFRNFIDGNWDVMYVLPESIEDSAIESIIGLEYPGRKDAARLILFISDGEIVYDQIDHLSNGGRKVHFPRGEKMRYLPREAVFMAHRQNDSVYLERK